MNKELCEIIDYIASVASHNPSLQSQWLESGDDILVSNCMLEPLMSKSTLLFFSCLWHPVQITKAVCIASDYIASSRNQIWPFCFELNVGLIWEARLALSLLTCFSLQGDFFSSNWLPVRGLFKIGSYFILFLKIQMCIKIILKI